MTAPLLTAAQVARQIGWSRYAVVQAAAVERLERRIGGKTETGEIQ